MRWSGVLVLAGLAACGGDTVGIDDAPGATDSDSVTDTDTDVLMVPDPDTVDTAGPTTTGETADTAVEQTIDCAALPATPSSSKEIVGASGYHGLVFTDTGQIVGTDNNNMMQADYYGVASVYRPNTGSLEQLEIMADGTIIAASNSGLSRIEVSGAIVDLASIPSAYGVRLGPDGMAYVADWDEIWRVDPVTGDRTSWLDAGNQFAPKVLDFNVDFTQMYIGSIFDDGKVYVIDLDSNYDPIGTPTVFAETSGGWHDGLGVDICGNVYVAEFNTSGMYRITPDGVVSTLFTLGNGGYGHGLTWGNGIGGFREDAIYIPQPYNGDTVAEAVIEVPYRTYTGPVINGP